MRNIKISKDWIILFATCDYIIDIDFDFFCGFVFWVFFNSPKQKKLEKLFAYFSWAN